MNDSTIKILKEILRKEGLRYTKQRQAVWDEIQNSKEHRDAEVIYMFVPIHAVFFCRYPVHRSFDFLVYIVMLEQLYYGIIKN